jgi:L-methionine (R)-S-oxide reductase
MNEDELAAELRALVSASGDREQRGGRVAAAIRRFGGYRWAGVYDVASEEIRVVGWDGPAPPTHSHFPRSRGLCGAVVATGEAVVVGDVAADARYLTTHTTTRSEIVVPVFRGDVVVGLIDVESEQPDAFGESDKRFLERCSAVVAPFWGAGAADTGPTAEAPRGA